MAPSSSTSRIRSHVQVGVGADDVRLLELLVGDLALGVLVHRLGSCQSSVKYSSGMVAFQTRAPSSAASSSSAHEKPVWRMISPVSRPASSQRRPVGVDDLGGRLRVGERPQAVAVAGRHPGGARAERRHVHRRPPLGRACGGRRPWCGRSAPSWSSRSPSSRRPMISSASSMRSTCSPTGRPVHAARASRSATRRSRCRGSRARGTAPRPWRRTAPPPPGCGGTPARSRRCRSGCARWPGRSRRAASMRGPSRPAPTRAGSGR